MVSTVVVREEGGAAVGKGAVGPTTQNDAETSWCEHGVELLEVGNSVPCPSSPTRFSTQAFLTFQSVQKSLLINETYTREREKESYEGPSENAL